MNVAIAQAAVDRVARELPRFGNVPRPDIDSHRSAAGNLFAFAKAADLSRAPAFDLHVNTSRRLDNA